MEIAMDPSGTHALQSLIEIINLNKNEDLIKGILNEENILKLSFNCNGTHILQKVISCFEEDNRSKINKCILENFCRDNDKTSSQISFIIFLHSTLPNVSMANCIA